MRTLITLYLPLVLLILASCGADEQRSSAPSTPAPTPDTVTEHVTYAPDSSSYTVADMPDTAIYANKRFRNVQLEKVGTNKYHITGQGQIFEASFGWVVEDGHTELMQGHEMTSMGAPEWGDFGFNIEVSPERPNSVLHLILFETSAKDGTRQHELAIPLK